MGLDIRIIREQTLMKGNCYEGVAITGNELGIVAREELGSWHGFYPLSDWARDHGEGDVREYSFKLTFLLEDLEELRTLLTKALEERDPSLFPQIEDMGPDYYWECVKELEAILDKEITRERARETLDQYSTYYIEGDW